MKASSFILVLLMLVVSCSPSDVDNRLRYAEDVMAEHPDSALETLSQIPIDSLGSSSQRARYALLVSMAKDKNHIDEIDDSLINIAVRYYDGSGDSRRRMLAHYYYAVIHFNSGDYRTAITELMKTEGLAREISDGLYCAMSNDMIADTYYMAYNVERANKYRRRAIEEYRKVGRTLNVFYGQADIARAYDNAKQYDDALAVLDSIVIDSAVAEDSTFMGYYIDSYIRPLMMTGRIDEALDKYNELRRYWGRDHIELYDYPLISCLFLEHNEIDSALYYQALAERYAMDIDEGEALQHLNYRLAKSRGDDAQALEGLEQMLDIHNSKMKRAFLQSVALADRDYFNSQYVESQLRLSRLRIVAICIAVIFIALCVALSVFYRLRLRRKAAEAETAMLDMRLQLGRQSSLIKDLFSEHFSTLDNLSSEYFEKQDATKAVRDTLIRDFEWEIERVRRPESIAKIQATVNACLNGVVDKMRQQLPWMKEGDITFLSLIFAGLSSRTVCLLTGNKIGNYYNKRRRLSLRIADSDAPDKAVFLKYMRK